MVLGQRIVLVSSDLYVTYPKALRASKQGHGITEQGGVWPKWCCFMPKAWFRVLWLHLTMMVFAQRGYFRPRDVIWVQWHQVVLGQRELLGHLSGFKVYYPSKELIMVFLL